MNTSINDIMGILQDGMIQIPKPIFYRTDIRMETRILFSSVYSECLAEMECFNNILGKEFDIEAFREAMIDHTKELRHNEIRYESFCNDKTVKYVRAELLSLIRNIDLEELLIQCNSTVSNKEVK